jgi:large subunit ribosomal protein L4
MRCVHTHIVVGCGLSGVGSTARFHSKAPLTVLVHPPPHPTHRNTPPSSPHQGTASTLTRAEVRGGGRKPYAQKGTGNARQGSRRTPLRPGGGIIFGPKPRDWGIKMNKKERRLALGTALQSAAGATVVVDAVSLAAPKTAELVGALARLGADPMTPGAHVLLVVDAGSPELTLAARNIEGLTVARVGALNAYDVLRADRIVVEKAALDAIQDFYGPKAE